MEMEKQRFGKQMFAGPGRDTGTQNGLSSLGQPWSFPHHNKPIFFADLSGNNCILGTVPLSKFFRQLRER